jgi:hypothetical protein
MLQILNVTQKLDGIVTEGAPRMTRRNSDVSSLLTNDVIKKTDRYQII